MTRPLILAKAEETKFWCPSCAAWTRGYPDQIVMVAISGVYAEEDLDDDWTIAEDYRYTQLRCRDCNYECDEDNNEFEQVEVGQTVYCCDQCECDYPNEELAEDCCD